MAPCLPMPSANPEIKQPYINGHFCYVFKFGIVTNGLGIYPTYLFITKNFYAVSSGYRCRKETDSLTKINVFMDSKLLIPTLERLLFQTSAN